MSGSKNRVHQAAGVILVALGLGSAALLCYGFVVGKNAYVLPLAILQGFSSIPARTTIRRGTKRFAMQS